MTVIEPITVPMPEPWPDSLLITDYKQLLADIDAGQAAQGICLCCGQPSGQRTNISACDECRRKADYDD